METTVLLVDDQPGFVNALALNLRARGYEVNEATTVQHAIARFEEHRPDVVLLDVGLPDGSGRQVIDHIRTSASTPIIVVSARHDDRDIVAMLDAGADGYITKPFGLDELLARLRSALRRTTSSASSEQPLEVVRTPHFEIDLAARVVRGPSGAVRLTPTEWAIVDHLCRANGRLVPHHELLEAIWGSEVPQHNNYLRVHMVQIRRKLEPEPNHPIYFVTEPRQGLRFDQQPQGIESVPTHPTAG